MCLAGQWVLHKGGGADSPGKKKELPRLRLLIASTPPLDTALPDKVVFPAYKGSVGLNPRPDHTPFFLPWRGSTMSPDLVLIQRWAITVI